MQQTDSIVIIPTYNEKENIENIIRAVLSLEHGFHVLVIDDGSPDGTAQIVKEMMTELPDKIFLLERSGKLGLGTAYIMGFKWALERDYEYIYEMDADFSHNPNDLPRLYEACAKEGADVSIGSRYVSGVNVVNWPIGRVLSIGLCHVSSCPTSHRNTSVSLHAYRCTTQRPDLYAIAVRFLKQSIWTLSDLRVTLSR